MRKQRKMEYESPQVAEIDLLLTDFMEEIGQSQDLPDMNVNNMNEDQNEKDFWG